MGERLLEPLRHMAEGAAAWATCVEHLEAQPQGVVRVTAPPGIAHDFLVPFAAELRDRQPLLKLQILARIEFLDLARREAELALRVRRTEQKELEVLFELESPVGAFAAKDYAARISPSLPPREVAFIGWAPPYDDLPPNRQLSERIADFTPAFACDDYLVQCRAAELGLGVIFLPLVRHRFALNRGLEHIAELDPGPETKGHVQLIASKAALSLPKVRLVADALIAELQQIKPY